MTHGILRANVMDRKFIGEALSIFDSYGSFYEHNTFSAGVVYGKDELEGFLRNHGIHPFNMETAEIENCKDTLENFLRSDAFITTVFESVLPIPRDLPLLGEYTLYDVYTFERYVGF